MYPVYLLCTGVYFRVDQSHSWCHIFTLFEGIITDDTEVYQGIPRSGTVFQVRNCTN
ncbi:hypothetical protein I79_006068 [Cricetulus griseus]|uniref:Uncharacterized protein n=1 Tax=Cricetulus griseus TaxID=10029 RepID=G3H6U8_CRIGR|nr:hypothetical protein I79_006068 [Cricetulus griseus]